jgi:uncharacterized protein YndB with AHSA1/START domain
MRDTARPWGKQAIRPETRKKAMAKTTKPDPKPSTGAVRLHRGLAAPPEKLYRALLVADAMAKWLPPYGFTCKAHHMDATVGGTLQMSFTNFTTGRSHAFGGAYLELVPNERIRCTDVFDDPNLPGVMDVTVTTKAISVGTEISIEQGDISGTHSGGGLHSRLATIAGAVGAGCRAKHSGVRPSEGGTQQ